MNDLPQAQTDPIPVPVQASSEDSDQHSRVDLRFNLPPGSSLEIVVETRAPDGSLLEQRSMRLANPPLPAGGVFSGWRERGRALIQPLARMRLLASWQTWLFAVALLLYLLTRLWALDEFPIYFFTDEAVQTVRAADLVRDQFRGYSKEFLPTFFPNGNQYNLSVSVYLQVIPYLLFGYSVWVTRGVAALMTLLAAWAVWRVLRDIYESPYAWVGVLLLAATPAWFLHSRTAFETALASSFFAAFLLFYMLYRCKSPRYLYAAVALGALAFYTYSPMQMIMLVTALLLLLVDVRYHWQQRGVALRGLGLALLLALPYVRYLVNHPTENVRHLEIVSSYWVQNLTLPQKLARFGSEYLRGLDPAYWFLSNDTDLPRHRMGTSPHLLRISLPLMFLGIMTAVRDFRFPPNRVLLAALLAAPAGAALVGVGITRLLAMVIPAVLLSALGLMALLGWLERLRLKRAALTVVVFGLLAGSSLFTLNDALANGPTWFHDYGLGGMQYGARQIFPVIQDLAAANPERRYLLSPSWTNGTEEVTRFFTGDDRLFDLGSVEGYLLDDYADLEQTTFVMIPEELRLATASGKFANMTLERVLLYPDGRPGFFFIHMKYSGSFHQMLESEKQNRKIMQVETVNWNGQPAQVRYPALDMGQIADALDGDPKSILRTLEANPLRLDIRPEQLRAASTVRVRVGGNPTQLTLQLYTPGASRPLIYRQAVDKTPEPRFLNFNLGRQVEIERLVVEVLSTGVGEPAHVHLWEVSAQP